MKIIKCLLGCFLVLISLSGCQKESKEDVKGETLQVVNEGDYATLLPYVSSDASIKHASLHTDLSHTISIGMGLMELSKDYFSPNTYSFREGEFLDFDTLDAATNASTGLLGRYNKKSNTIGLNPMVDDEFPCKGGGSVKIGPRDILLYDIMEYDWYKNGKLAGLSLAFVLNDVVGEEGKEQTIDPDKMAIYAEESVRKTVDFIRKRVPEVGNDTPIFVALYNINAQDPYLPGNFYQAAYFKTKINGEFYGIDENWMLFSSEEATQKDSTTSNCFARYKKEFKDVMPQDVAMVAKGHYRGGKLSELRIDVTLHASTSGEIMSAVQLLNERLDIFPSDYLISVDISCDNQHIGIIEREAGKSKTEVITLM